MPIPRLGCRRRGGFTLIEIVVALMILAIALVGLVSLILAVQTHNQSFSDARMSHKACQEVMELLLGMQYSSMRAQNGVRFIVPVLHPTRQIGRVTLRDVSPPADPTTITEIEVSVNTQGVGLKPLNVSIVSRRTSK